MKRVLKSIFFQQPEEDVSSLIGEIIESGPVPPRYQHLGVKFVDWNGNKFLYWDLGNLKELKSKEVKEIWEDLCRPTLSINDVDVSLS